jgi:hypothetical protein
MRASERLWRNFEWLAVDFFTALPNLDAIFSRREAWLRRFERKAASRQFETIRFMQRPVLFLCLLFLARSAAADTLFPSAVGTSWKYQMTQEFGEGVRPGADQNTKLDADGKVRLPVTMFVAGTEEIDGAETKKYELHRQGKVQLTEFYKFEDAAVRAMARSAEGEMYKIIPPQKLLTLPPHEGEKWNYTGKVGDSDTTQEYEIVAREKIDVPAGKFDAYHLRLTQSSPTPPKVVEERWFVPNVGYVKIMTVMKRADDQLLQRIDLELTEGPKIAERPPVSSAPAAEKKVLSAALAKERTSEPTSTFAPDHPKIFARWQGEALQEGDKIRAVWIAEDVGDVAPPNYKLDEASVTADGRRAFGTFTITKPNKGWPVGKYHVDFYRGDQLVETLKFEIVK